MKKMWKKLLVMGLTLGMVFAGSAVTSIRELTVQAAGTNIAEGNQGQITWVIDSNGHLAVNGTGDFLRDEENKAPWLVYADQIKTAEVNVTGMTNASEMFFDCINLESVDVSNFDTSRVTSMRSMFNNCSSLSNLDVSGFDTSSVTDMECMFSNCSSLSKLDVSGFDTSRVTSMRHMFSGCSSLRELDVSGFDTSKLTDMGSMFSDCSSLRDLDVSGFDTSNVRSMWNMFSDCSSLRELDLSGFDTSNVESMEDMFYNCSSLRDLDVSGFDTSKVTSMTGIFSGCSSLRELDVSGFDTSNVRSMWNMFSGCSSLRELDLSGFNTSNVTTMESMFNNCSSLSELDVSGFDTSKVRYMQGMFRGCSSLTELDLGSFDMKNVSSADRMIVWGRDLNLGIWTHPNLVKIITPKNLQIGVALPLKVGEFSDRDFYYWHDEENNIFYGLPLKMSESKQLVFRRQFEYPIQGVKNNITWSIDESGHLSVSGTGELYDKEATVHSVPWGEYCDLIKTAEINVKNISDVSGLFLGCSNLTKVNLSNFDTSKVTNMSDMFYNCRSLAELDVSGFDTSKVTNMSDMFYNCSSLSDLDVSGFDTSKVTNMALMFYDCRSLAELDVSGFDTSKVTNMSNMFYNCSSLSDLDVSGFDTSKVTSMSRMFSGCSSLTELDLSSFNTSKIVNCSGMFGGCENLQYIYGNFDLSNAREKEYMYAGCTNLKKTPTGIPVAGVIQNKQGNITWEIGMDEKLTVNGTGDFLSDEGNRAPWLMYVDHIKTAEIHLSEATNLSGMFEGCVNLSEIDLSNLETENVTDMSNMFKDCFGLFTLDVSNFNTQNVTDMSGMFENCRYLTIDLNSFDTRNVTNMSQMFSGCLYTKRLDLSSFDMSNVKFAEDFLKECSELQEIKVPKHCGHEIELMGAWQDSEKNIYMNLPQHLSDSVTISRVYGQIEWSLDDDGHLTINGVGDLPLDSNGISAEIPWNEYADQIKTAEVNVTGITSVRRWFDGCVNLKSIDVSGLDTRDVGRMEYMFRDCSSLENIDVSGFDIGNLGSTDHMFAGCTSLTELDLSTWVSTKSVMLDAMFKDCTNLKKIDLSGFKKAHMAFTEVLFEGCSSLETIKTIPNWEYTCYLPAENKDDTWYGIDGNKYTKLPKRLPYSITLTKNKLPAADETVTFDYENQQDGTIVITGYSSNSTETPAMFSVIRPALSLGTAARTKSVQKDLLIPTEINGKKVTGIKENAFANSQEIVSVQIPASITNIGKNAFANCVKLENVIVGENIQVIGERAFGGCENLAAISFEKNIPEIEENTFENVSAKVYYRVDVSKEAESLKKKIDPAMEMEAFDKYPVATTFSDTYVNEWYIEYIQAVYDMELMTGLAGTTRFAPNANVTKAQVAQVLYNMEGKPAVGDQKVFKELKDVYASEWYAAAVAWAYNTGVVTGDTNAKKFFPNADVTREQLALMMLRYAKYKEYDVTASSDLAGLKNSENTSNWALDGVKWAVGTGLISGVEKNGVKDLQPQGNATRAQLATILERFCIEYRIIKHSM